MRGVKESVVPLIPVFMVFVITHVFVILWAIGTHLDNIPEVARAAAQNIHSAHQELGLFGMLLLMLRAYSLGAGTYTGIEAVSNGLPILREPKVQTGKRTMAYMAVSLAFTATGLMIAYLLIGVHHAPGKTLNATLFESITATWGAGGHWFVLITLISEAMLLFVAAQAGFLDGPRVLANMALDRWMPTKFATLSDRLVSQNGILLMGGAGLLMMLVTQGNVRLLVVLYSINVFITFVLSQLGMVRHWWQERLAGGAWKKKLAINGVGLALTAGILLTVTILKFHEGGWITLLITGSLIGLSLGIRRHYNYTRTLLNRLDSLVEAIESITEAKSGREIPCDPNGKTAVILVSGFNGLGLHTLLGILRVFSGHFKNFVFIQIGVVDAGNFKGAAEVERLRHHCLEELDRYVTHMHAHGHYAASYYSVGTDVVEELSQIAPRITAKYPNAVFFGGQLVFPEETFASRWLHNYTVFSVQRRFYRQGIPFVLLPIRV
jgi:hypothetical protein